MKKPKIDFSDHVVLDEIVSKWRNIVGVDPVYLIEIIENPEDDGFPAYVDGLTIDNPHPTAHIFINAHWLQRNKYNEREIISTVIHELVHIMIFDPIIQMNPQYKYEGVQARANENLTMKITRAIMLSYYQETP